MSEMMGLDGSTLHQARRLSRFYRPNEIVDFVRYWRVVLHLLKPQLAV
jgi:hypothetical protein